MHLHFSGPAFETLGAVPAICKGVMYYRTLNRTSKLYLARAHLSIRIDEWPHEPFSRPMDFPEDQIADVWIPPSLETTALKVVKLQTACAPVRKPPHADISECSSMALQLALPPSGPDGDCLHGEADGADVRGHIHEAKDEGPSAGSLLPKADGHDHADGDDRCPDSAQQPAELPERSSHLSSRQRLAKLRRWRQEDDHLRSMRCSLDPEHRQGQVIDPMCAKGITPLKLPAHVLERKEYPLHTDDIGRARSSTETARSSSTRGWASSSAGARLSPSLSLKQAKPKIIPSSVSVRLKAHNLAQQQQEMDEDASMRSWEAPEVPYMRRRPPKSYTRASTGYSASILQDDAQEMHEGSNGEMEWQARPRPVPKMQPSVVQEELEFNEDGEQVWRRTQGAIHVTMADEELGEVDAEEEFS